MEQPDQGIFEVMATCRAMRYIKPDAVPGELVEKVIWAATRAPSPAWDFVVVDDRAALSTIATAISAAMSAAVAGMARPDRTTRLMLDGTEHLLATLATAPVVIFVCGPVAYPPHRPRRAVHMVGALPGGPEPRACGSRLGPRDDLHDAPHGGRADGARRARHPRRREDRVHDPDGLAGCVVRSGEPPTGRRCDPSQQLVRRDRIASQS
jgi:nitroreductase